MNRMKQNIARDAESYMKNHRKKGRWYKLVTGLACIVVFCTTYALILPAITLEGNQCGIEEHTHTDECYTQVTSITRKVPVCTEEGLDIHEHSEKCYDDQKNLICGYADFVAHKHDETCYREDGTLWCPLEEREPHVHDESCYTLPEPHVHTDECYTLERGELTCTEHVHTDECYTEATGLTCGLEESEGHHHDESCHDAEGNLVCGQEESEGHHHSESCYGPVRTLTCDHQGDHQHTDACYEQEKVLTCELSTDPVTEQVLVCGKEEILLHTHTEECYDKHGNLTCGHVEIKEHKHTDACFREEQEPVDTEALTCTLPEDENHTHTARCYGTWELTCGKEEHTHGPGCSPSMETEEDWMAAASKDLTGNWLEDMVKIAKSQLEYQESDTDVKADEDGNESGATRYGVKYGDPYAQWNTLFSMCCMDCAQIPEEVVPRSADIQVWINQLSELGIYQAREETATISRAKAFNSEAVVLDTAAQNTPDGPETALVPRTSVSPGDVAFFDTDGDGAADRTGIIVQIQDGTVTTIQGDVDGEVRACDTPAENPSILGYALLPANLDEAATLLSAGGVPDTLYLDFGSVSWGDANARIILAYKSTNNGEWKFAEMAPESTNANIYQIPLPGDMDKNNSEFKFVRMDPNKEIRWDSAWDEAPSSGSNNLTLAPGKNCFRLTGWKDGQWETSWYTPAGGTVTTLYLDLTQFRGWENMSAVFYLSYQATDNSSKAVQLIKQEGETYYSVTIPEDMNTSAPLVFQRRDPNNGSVWNRTSDEYLPNDGRNCYVIMDWDNSGYWKKVETGVTGDTRAVYYDATLSKLSYNGDGGTNTIPMANDNNEGDQVWCHWWNDTSDGNVKMGKDHADVYRADIPNDAVHVLFYSSSNGAVPDNGSNKTIDLEIPATLEKPCFYGDTSDSAIYEGGKREGYWDEVDTVRDAEAGKDSTVVDIASGTQIKSNDVLYVNTTLYDYYTDYELNGNNRDNYASDGVPWTSHRIYQPFRQFNQALSAYYEQNSASNPLYWGNFQNYDGSHFREISGTMNLYGSGNTSKFFAENNSMWGYNGGNVGNNGEQATQGLVDATLSGGTLTMRDIPAPFFSESFLTGENAKNTVLGKVYHNVSFPFVKKDIKNNGVEYWYFDSSDTGMANSNLQLRQEDGSYFLNKGSVVNGWAPDHGTGAGYFPFNTGDQSGKATQLNYGFGQRFDISFRLTQDGTVTDKDGNAVPVEFNFSGDDDVWVFVDGQLVLDIGGDHGKVSGTINFKDGTSTVSRVKKSEGGTSDGVRTSFSWGNDFYKSEHTLTMFYMERGLWESNMKITFNFPDENLLAVEKQVDTSGVNTLFQSLFNNKVLFTFNIKTMATHFGTQAASGETVAPVSVALTGNLSTPSSDITFDHTIENGAIGETNQNNILRWRCRIDDSGSSYRSQRYGKLALTDPVSLSGQQYLQFDFWYNWSDTPSLNRLFVDLLDESGTPLTTEYLSVSSCVSGSPVMKNDQWITLRLDLDRMGVNRSGSVKYIRIGYDLGRNVYIRNMSFRPATTVQSSQVGFVTPQNIIPDYGTASSGELAIPVNAIYTSSSGNAYRIGTDGTFTLQNGETVTFHDQFRRGSYMYLSEDTNPLYITTWSMYEGMNQSPVASSTVPGGATTVTGGEQSMAGVVGSVVTDGRVEVARAVTGENDTRVNKYQTDGTILAPDSAFVFRHYSDPDNTTTTTKLTVKFTNTVKTGSLTIAKAQAEGSENLSGHAFTFYVEFHNVGGMGLEGSESILDGPYTIPVDQSRTISGIPVGTQFTIHEVKPDNGDIVLDHINSSTRPGTGTVNGSTTYTVTGTIPTSGTEQSYTFYNSQKSVVSVTVQKKWQSMQGAGMSQNLPTSIDVQLQRSADSGKTWESVAGYEKVTLSPGYTPWNSYNYTFRDLDRYHTENVEYQYRVVELDSNGNVVGNDITLDGRKFTVTYSEVANTAEDAVPPAYSETITNREQPTGYELPHTGGTGTQMYTLGGLLLIAAAGLLAYSRRKRRKEDFASF